MDRARKSRRSISFWFVLVGVAATLAYPILHSASLVPSVPCLFRTITGIPCAMCGFGAAVGALVEGHLLRGFFINPLSVALVSSGLVYLVFSFVPRRKTRDGGGAVFLIANRRRGFIFVTLLLSVVGANWAYVLNG